MSIHKDLRFDKKCLPCFLRGYNLSISHGVEFFQIIRVNSIQTQNDYSSACRWSLNDATKVFFAYLALMFVGMPLFVRVLKTFFGFHALSNAELRMLALFASLFYQPGDLLHRVLHCLHQISPPNQRLGTIAGEYVL